MVPAAGRRRDEQSWTDASKLRKRKRVRPASFWLRELVALMAGRSRWVSSPSKLLLPPAPPSSLRRYLRV